MKLWIARDTSKDLHLFKGKPNLEEWGNWKGWKGTRHEYFYLGRDFFPEVTFENSPKEVELKLIEK